MFLNKRRKRRSTSTPTPTPTPTTQFYKAGGGTIPNPQNWADWIRNQDAPVQKPGHRLPDLGQYLYGSADPYVRLALARFGYAVDLGGQISSERADIAIADSLTANPVTAQGIILKAIDQNPGVYRLQFQVHQRSPGQYENESPYTVSGQSAYCRDASGNRIGVYSPVQEEVDRQFNATNKAAGLIKIQQKIAGKATVSLVTDGGENGLNITGDWANTYALDPRVVADAGAASWTDNLEGRWVDYISRKKAYEQTPVSSALRTASPDRQALLYYPCVPNPYRGKVAGWNLYDYDYAYMRPVADYASGSIYYKELNFNTGLNEMLTLQLASSGKLAQDYGSSLSFDFVSGGWFGDGNAPRPDPFADLGQFEGWLKCCKTAGQLSAILGYFSSDGFYSYTGSINPYPAYDSGNIPNLFRQFLILADVHARFTWLEEYLFDGDLIESQNNHQWYPNLKSHEIPCKRKIGALFTSESNVRCVARKMKNINKWLITVWTHTGTTSVCTINDIPGVEEITVASRPQGCIYTIDKTTSTTVIIRQDP